ncbi:hypothetical protein, partial [Escherichia coli]|uniref:hypothetical protein n=1 Tax=Escherichia coli TaxID=562 RepID=UPI00197C7754
FQIPESFDMLKFQFVIHLLPLFVLCSQLITSCSQNNFRVPVGVNGKGIKVSGLFNHRRSVLVDTFAILANCSNVIAFMCYLSVKK